MARISTLDDLLALYPQPAARVQAKKQPALDEGMRAVLALSPFVLLATAGADGTCDVSPRGGPPGFVKVLDDRHLVLPDLNGNNLLDGLRNIVVNPHAALLVVVPGQNDTMRIDGSAMLTTDDTVLDLFTDEVRRPTLAIVIEIAHVFTHCSKSFRRGSVWDPETWVPSDRSLLLEARYRQLGLDISYEQYAAESEEKIAADLAADAPD
jgi:PPOX class probable FMN-dependent enzyme